MYYPVCTIIGLDKCWVYVLFKTLDKRKNPVGWI